MDMHIDDRMDNNRATEVYTVSFDDEIVEYECYDSISFYNYLKRYIEDGNVDCIYLNDTRLGRHLSYFLMDKTDATITMRRKRHIGSMGLKPSIKDECEHTDSNAKGLCGHEEIVLSYLVIIERNNLPQLRATINKDVADEVSSLIKEDMSNGLHFQDIDGKFHHVWTRDVDTLTIEKITKEVK